MRDRRACPAAQQQDMPTGRQLVLLRRTGVRAAARALHNTAGLKLRFSHELDGAVGKDCLKSGQGVVFTALGAALLYADPDQTHALARASAQRHEMEPERRLRGSDIVAPVLATRRSVAADSWALRAMRCLSSPYSGRGVRVAILDSGLDLRHPDFAERVIVARSFVAGFSVEDGNGHGTNSAGVACGARSAGTSPGYGAAWAANLYIARVLDDDACGLDGDVLAGIDWAIRQECAVIELSLGTPVLAGEGHSEIYQEIARRALSAGSLLVAPAGNHSSRPDRLTPVQHPANCPSILAVGAVDADLAVAPFSNATLPGGGRVGLVAPGDCVATAALRPALYQSVSGTSVAAPCVAGIAALWAQAQPTARGRELRDLLLRTCLRLPAAAQDVGAGLVQAPQ
jgi:subtilisin family serine protease